MAAEPSAKRAKTDVRCDLCRRCPEDLLLLQENKKTHSCRHSRGFLSLFSFVCLGLGPCLKLGELSGRAAETKLCVSVP